MARSIVAGALGLASLLGAAAACAQPAADDVRRELIAQAIQARDTGDLTRAVALAREAAALRSTPSLSLLLAELERSRGQTLPALDEARACRRALDADPAYHDWSRYADACRALVVELEARARADVSAERERAEQVTVPAVVPPAPAPVVPVTRVSVTPVAAPWWRAAGAGPWVTVGVGAASLVTAGVFFALRGGALAARDEACGSAMGACAVATDQALATATEAQGDAHTFNTLGNVTLAVGGAALVGGALWWALGRPNRSSPQLQAVVVTTSAAGATLALGGTM